LPVEDPVSDARREKPLVRLNGHLENEEGVGHVWERRVRRQKKKERSKEGIIIRRSKQRRNSKKRGGSQSW
jgi:hypothetical protein